ncbi:glycosyltransferase family 4 protein [Methanoplanus endosymbiosus]|uniref:glycosyltransferase family 4 protein n=1 Tax=Methanoplanus endosymbiosus TaxID=33865 RepID=UPI0027E308E5|nr:glycosyltransferase family 1 protein [Methanoplanus endosymbiosus]
MGGNPGYNCADLFVYPSKYEGFGLPPLEAMACGCPVITSNISSLPEVVGNAGLQINPNNPALLAEAMSEILNDDNYRNDYALKGLERAKQFSWEKCAKETMNAYLETLND